MREIKSEVPQYSILRPILYLLYTYDTLDIGKNNEEAARKLHNSKIPWNELRWKKQIKKKEFSWILSLNVKCISYLEEDFSC